MEFRPRLLVCVWVAVLWGCVLGLHRPPPRYSQQYMPETAFSCRNKIVGSYYADPETDCQVFHVCVSVAGSVQDYKFLCPNDTAFDQESQTCADWYDVDCEAATLYYASDNFDLYRIGSGLESVHYDQLRSDAEPQDHLQRSETSDPVRSSANNLKYSASNYNGKSNAKDLLKGSSSSNFYNKNNKEDEYETERPFKDEEAKKKTGVRKVSRKQQYSGNGASNYGPSTTAAPAPANQNSYTGFYSGNTFNNQRSSTYAASSTARPAQQDNHNRNGGQRYNAPSSTHRAPTTYQDNFSYPSSTTGRSTYNYNQNYNQNSNYNQQASNFGQNSNYQNSNYNNGNAGVTAQSTTLRPTTYKNSYQNYNGNQYTQTTPQPSTNYQQQDYNTNYQQRNYNNVQRTGGYQSSTPPSTSYDNYNNGNQFRSTARQDSAQTTTKYYPNYASSSFAPTTYSPATKKFVTETVQNPRNENGQQYFDKSGQTAKSSTQYYDSTKAPKKATQYSNYDAGNSGKYYSESSTGTYELSRSSPVGIGFSPASINHLAESPRSTTPVPRRPSSATTYNPNSYNTNSQRASQQSVTTPRGSTYVSGSAKPFTSTTRFPSSTTARPKAGKKNDYDYAYYDNAGGLEYDGLELEHVANNKESTKISRN